MKNKILLLVIFCTLTLSLNASKDTLETSLKIINGEEIFQPQSDFWDKYSSGIIAGITILISLGISVWQARVSQRHTRANSIAEARIQWITELRPLMSKLISESSEIADNYRALKVYFDPNRQEFHDISPENDKDFIQRGNNLDKLRNEHKNTFNQIKLFLNKTEKEHNDFIISVEKFIKNSMKEFIESDFKNDLKTSDLVNKAQIVLKNAWEQAKNEKHTKYWF